MKLAYLGYVRDTFDALAIFEACRLGVLDYTHVRLSVQGRKDIKSGSIFVWEQNLSGIKRWTDGRNWSASRYVDHFLVYKELKHKQFHSEVAYLEGGLSKRSICIESVDGKKFHLINYYRDEDIPHLKNPANDTNLNFVLPNNYYLFENDFINQVRGNRDAREQESMKQVERPFTFIHHTSKDSFTTQNSSKSCKVSSDPFPTNVSGAFQSSLQTQKLAQRASFYDQTTSKVTFQPEFIPTGENESRAIGNLNEHIFNFPTYIKKPTTNIDSNLPNLEEELSRSVNTNTNTRNTKEDSSLVKRNVNYSSEDKRLLDLLHANIKM